MRSEEARPTPLLGAEVVAAPGGTEMETGMETRTNRCTPPQRGESEQGSPPFCGNRISPESPPKHPEPSPAPLPQHRQGWPASFRSLDLDRRCGGAKGRPLRRKAQAECRSIMGKQKANGSSLLGGRRTRPHMCTGGGSARESVRCRAHCPGCSSRRQI